MSYAVLATSFSSKPDAPLPGSDSDVAHHGCPGGSTDGASAAILTAVNDDTAGGNAGPTSAGGVAPPLVVDSNRYGASPPTRSKETRT